MHFEVLKAASGVVLVWVWMFLCVLVLDTPGRMSTRPRHHLGGDVSGLRASYGPARSRRVDGSCPMML